MKLGEKITQIRKEQQLSQEAFAEQFNVTRQTVSNWENGKSTPDLEMLIKISEVFNLSVDDLIKNKSPKEGDTLVEKTTQKKKFLLIGVFLVLLLLAIRSYAFLSKKPTISYHMKDNQAFTPDKNQTSHQLATGHFNVPKASNVNLAVAADVDSGNIKVTIIQADTKELVYEKESDDFEDKQKVWLPQGAYDIQITVNGYQETIVSVTYAIQVNGS